MEVCLEEAFGKPVNSKILLGSKFSFCWHSDILVKTVLRKSLCKEPVTKVLVQPITLGDPQWVCTLLNH